MDCGGLVFLPRRVFGFLKDYFTLFWIPFWYMLYLKDQGRNC